MMTEREELLRRANEEATERALREPVERKLFQALRLFAAQELEAQAIRCDPTEESAARERLFRRAAELQREVGDA